MNGQGGLYMSVLIYEPFAGSFVGFDSLDSDVHSGLKEASGYHTLSLVSLRTCIRFAGLSISATLPVFVPVFVGSYLNSLLPSVALGQNTVFYTVTVCSTVWSCLCCFT